MTAPSLARRLPPAVTAAGAMLLAAIAMLAVAMAQHRFTGQPLDVRVAALVHGLLTLGLVWWWGLPWWWRWIAALFAPAVALHVTFAVPAWVWAVAFLLVAGLSWGAVVTRVPLFLSSPAIWRQVESLVPQGAVRVIDLGSGLGGLVLHLARNRPEATVEGIELAPVTWLLGWVRARLRGSPARMRFGDYRSLDFAAYDVAFAFLSPAAMPALWQQASAGMRAGTLLISCEFTVPGHEPSQRIELPGERPLLVWSMPGPALKQA